MFFEIKCKGRFYKMKGKLILVLGILLVFSLAFLGCDDDKTTKDIFTGTWVNDGEGDAPPLKIIAADGSLKAYSIPSNKEVIRGTYSVSGNNVNLQVTQVNTALFGGSDEWVPWANLSATYKAYMGGSNPLQITIQNNSFVLLGSTFTKQ